MPAAAIDAMTDEHIPQGTVHGVGDATAQATARGPDIDCHHLESVSTSGFYDQSRDDRHTLRFTPSRLRSIGFAAEIRSVELVTKESCGQVECRAELRGDGDG